MAITYSKKLRESAASKGKDLFSCGYAEAKGNGRFEFDGPMESRMAEALVLFAYAVIKGKKPHDAFQSIQWPERPEAK